MLPCSLRRTNFYRESPYSSMRLDGSRCLVSFSTFRMSANNFPFFFCSRHWPPHRRRTRISKLISRGRYLTNIAVYARSYQSVTIICNRAIACNRCLDIINVDIQNVPHGRYINWGNLPRWRYVIRSPGKKMRASVCHTPLPLTLYGVVSIK